MFPEIAAQISLSFSSPYLALASLGTIGAAGMLGWRWWQLQNAYKSLRSLPSPPKHWLLGNIPQILAAVKEKKYFQLLFDWAQQLGPMYVCWTDYPIVI